MNGLDRNDWPDVLAIGYDICLVYTVTVGWFAPIETYYYTLRIR